MRTKTKVLFGVVGLLILAVAAVVGVYLLWLPHQAEDQSELDPVVEALHRLERETEDEPDFYFQNGFPRYVQVKVPVEGQDSVSRARNFLNSYRELYQQNDPKLELHLRRVEGEQEEFVIFYQTYLGIEVFGSEIVVLVNGEDVTATVGGLLPSGVVLDTMPLVDASQAVEIAKKTDGRVNAFIMGEPTLMVYDPAVTLEVPSEPHLAWRIAVGPGSAYLAYIDAHSGEILLESEHFFSNYELDHEDANGYQYGYLDCYWDTTDDDWIGDEDGLDEDYHNQVDAVNSWWYSKWAYDFYWQEYYRDAYNGLGGELELYIYSGTPNGVWIGGTGCNLIEFHQGWVGWDVMVHEYAHGIEYYTSMLGMVGGKGQDFSLRESMADIQSMYADPDDWLQGDNRTGFSGFVRNIASPEVGHIDQLDGAGTGEAGYKNSGIPSRAAYLTAVGGTHTFYIGIGLGREKMAHLYYGVMTALPATAQFIDARNLAVSIATQHFTQEEVCVVKNAWATVGVGEADVGCDGIPDPDVTDTDEDHKIDAQDNCPEIYNPQQKDYDHDGIGDECDPDDDNDTVQDIEDNCPWVKNTDQSDVDNDGAGDQCEDADKDFVIDIEDNCEFVPNPNQIDTDEDGQGNACDLDLDGDGVNETGRNGVPLDNCPFKYNPDQLDSDGDGIGDACDGCPNDADEVQAYTAVDPFLASLGALPQPYQPDSDGDGIPDACDGKIRLDQAFLRPGLLSIEEAARRHKFELNMTPGSFTQVRLPACAPTVDDGYSPRTRGRIVLEGVGEGIGIWLGDSAGFGVGNAKQQGDQKVIEFFPRGGRDYFILVGMASNSPAGQAAQFSFDYRCYEAEDATLPPNEGFQLPESIPGFPPAQVAQPTPTATSEPDEPSQPEEGSSRCDLFDGVYPLTLLDIPYESTELTLFIEIRGGVPGLEIEIPADDQPWDYSAILGDVMANRCSYQGYAGRLYCDFGLPETYLDTVQPLAIFVNGCESPIFEHPRVSIFAPEEPLPVCIEDLGEDACTAAGGRYACTDFASGTVCTCVCP
jgi:Zn-dependent metalloprotease